MVHKIRIRPLIKFFFNASVVLVGAGRLLSPLNASAAANITSVTGLVQDNTSYTISGSGFGTHPLQVESLTANIEGGAVGAVLAKQGWTLSDWPNYGVTPKYANDDAHSGRQSLKCTHTNGGNCAFAYDMPDVAAGETFYISWWTRYEGQTSGQWKMFRASGPLTIVDNKPEACIMNWFDLQRYINLNPGAAGNVVYWMGGNNLPVGDGNWYRIGVYFKAGNTNTPNGSFHVERINDAGNLTTMSFSGVNSHIDTTDVWRWAIWQNYLGNGITTANVWLDDLYVQKGTAARVELCSGSTWAARGVCEVQLPEAWTDNSITVQGNTGKLGQTAHLFIVDANGTGTVNGFPVALNPSLPPAPQLNKVSLGGVVP